MAMPAEALRERIAIPASVPARPFGGHRRGRVYFRGYPGALVAAVHSAPYRSRRGSWGNENQRGRFFSSATIRAGRRYIESSPRPSEFTSTVFMLPGVATRIIPTIQAFRRDIPDGTGRRSKIGSADIIYYQEANLI